jgi:hypothetical protein
VVQKLPARLKNEMIEFVQLIFRAKTLTSIPSLYPKEAQGSVLALLEK